MKNMRKSLIAAATALTVSFAGVTVANALTTDLDAPTSETGGSVTAEDTTDTTDGTDGTEGTDGTTDEAPVDGEEEQVENPGSVNSSDMEAKEIRDWIAVFTAIIGALSTLFAFVNKLN